MGRAKKITVVTITSFAVYFFCAKMYFLELRDGIDIYINQIGLSHFLSRFIMGAPLFIGLFLTLKTKDILRRLGLKKPLGRGLIFSIVSTSPMFLGYFFFFNLNEELSFTLIFKGAITAAFIEELYYRGILFGQIYRFTKLGFISSVAVSALIFAIAHLHQAQDFYSFAGIFIATFSGAVLFAWLYVEWENNLWVPIFLHLFMNLSWMLYSVSSNAHGDVYANVFRIMTVIFAIGLTIVYKKKNKMPLEVKKGNLFSKKEVAIAV